MSCDVEISTLVAVMQCLLAIGDKKESEESKTVVFDSSLSFLSATAYRHCITATVVEISTS